MSRCGIEKFNLLTVFLHSILTCLKLNKYDKREWMKNYYLFVKLQHINCASLYRKPDMSTCTKQNSQIIYHFLWLRYLLCICTLFACYTRNSKFIRVMYDKSFTLFACNAFYILFKEYFSTEKSSNNVTISLFTHLFNFFFW